MPRPRLDKPNFRLRQRGNRWVVDWTEGGKPRTISTGETDRAAAEVWMTREIARFENPPPPAEPTIAEIMDGYLADRKGHVEALDRLEHAAKPIKRHIGTLRPDMLTKRMYWERRAADGVSPGTILREGVTLRSALETAANAKWIARPVPYIQLPPKPDSRHRWLTREEAKRLLAACTTPHLRLFVMLGIYGGARKGAILELEWSQVNMDQCTVDFRKPGRRITKKRRTVVRMPAPLVVAMQEAWLVRTSDGRVLEYGGKPIASIRTAFESAVERAGLSEEDGKVTPHALRHTCATWQVMAGVELEEVARFLGDTKDMVQRVYGHHSPEYLKRAAKALEGDQGVNLTTVKVIDALNVNLRG